MPSDTKAGAAWRSREREAYVAPTIVKSLRMRPELWDYVAERADRRLISPNAWIARLIEMHQQGKLKEG